jgi:hypothetical protein
MVEGEESARAGEEEKGESDGGGGEWRRRCWCWAGWSILWWCGRFRPQPWLEVAVAGGADCEGSATRRGPHPWPTDQSRSGVVAPWPV